MITILCVILGILISLLIISVGVFLEKRDFNNGICPDCGATLRFFDTDRKNMEITYFEVYLKDGTTFDFDYKCNKVDYGKGDYIVCIHKEKDEELVYETLAIIPRENVKYILAV